MTAAHDEPIPFDPDPHPAKHVRPWLWGLLYLPFGVTSGFVSVTLAYLLAYGNPPHLSFGGLYMANLMPPRWGVFWGRVPDSTIAGLVALNLLPHTWKFFWSPVADVTLTRKRWYTLSNLVSTATIVGIAFTPIRAPSLGVISALVFFNSLAITVLGMAVEGLMAHATPPEERGRAAGWFQAGNLGGSGVGGGVALLLAQHVSSKVAFLATAGLCLACQYILTLVPEETRVDHVGTFFRRFGHALAEVGKDLWSMLASRRGIIAVLLVFLPIGSAAASGLFSAMASNWNASAELVSMTGWVGGLVAVVGSLLGGWMSDGVGRRTAYILSGLILAAFAAGMGLAPRNAATYTIFVLLYNLGSGIAYGCFTGFVLSVIGKGAVATKYNALASLSNVPIWYMTLVLGWASTKHGQVHMLYVDALSEVAGVVLLILMLVIVRPGKDEA
ncbi:MAG TPA: MFS transporter [Kofleriaceae bacterium]|nr:MFS transporter [Kofleriaceae bacterium]